MEEELTSVTSLREGMMNILGDENPLSNLLQPSAASRLPEALIKLHCVGRETAYIRQQLQSYPATVERQTTSGAVMVDFSYRSDSFRNTYAHGSIEDAMVDTSDPTWRNIINNVATLEDALCQVGVLVEIELTFRTSFITMVQDLTGAENYLVPILQSSVSQQIPWILFNLYNVRRQIVHIHRMLQLHPAKVEPQSMPRSIVTDFSRPL